MAIKMIYRDLAIGADTDAEVTTTQGEAFSSPSLLPFGADTGAVATCELNAWGLTPTYKARGTQPFAFWSTTLSNDTGVFNTPPQIQIEFDNQYTSSGLTLRFSPDANEYSDEIVVIWTLDSAERDRVTVYPDTGNYALENTVEGFNGITIIFNKTNLPNRRLKIEYIGIGIVRILDGTELTSASFINEVDLVSAGLPANVADVSFHLKNRASLIFQKKQPVEAYDNDNLIGVYYIDTGERISSQNYSMSMQDAIGVLDGAKYQGCIHLEPVLVDELVNDVIGGLFEYELDSLYSNMTLTGYIPRKISRREALQKIAFAIGACVDTMGAIIKIFPPETGESAEIPATETYQGGKVTTSDAITSVTVTGYRIKEGEAGDYSEPIEFDGVSYKATPSTVTVRNPNISSDTLPNDIEYSGNYLITWNNMQARCEALMEYHMRRNIYSTKHIISGQKMADRAKVTLPWNETENANIRKMTITMSGIAASDSEFLLD